MTRVIPCLLLRNKGLVKTIKFKDTTYIGDPINAVRIFNEKEVDELVFLDIDATKKNLPIDFGMIKSFTNECFMPLSYGGGIRSVADIRTLLSIGVEKAIINSCAIDHPEFIKEAASKFGSSTVVVSMDVKKQLLGNYKVYALGGTKKTDHDPVAFAQQMEKLGAGELIVNSIDRDGVMKGYDIDLIKKITSAVSIPVVAIGGAGNLQDIARVVKEGGASAAAAGSIFIFYGPKKGVLINYPTQSELEQLFSTP